MAIIDIYSENPFVSWVLFKNPETQKAQGKPFEKAMRKGVLYSWYQDNQNFRLWFKEGRGQSSFYKNLNNDYLDQSPYNCAFAYCTMIGEMLSATVKSEHEKDTVSYNKVTISAMQVSLPRVMEFFVHFFSDKVKITPIQLGHKAYSFTFEGNVTLHYLTNLVQIFCLMQAIEDKNIFIDLTVNILIKYANNLRVIDAPYFVTYLFNSRCVPDYQSFQAVQPLLQKEGWSLNFGNTQRQRYFAIKKFMQGGKFLHDVGCGELYYSRQLATHYEKISAWDTDSAIQERNSKFLDKKSIYNVTLQDTFKATSVNTIKPGDDILITEMLEHMPKTEAALLLKEISTTDFRRLVVTLPNKDFNQFYRLGHEFRHDDHHWEPTYLETEEFIYNVFDKNHFSIIIKPIGDGVDGIHVSTLIVIERIV